MVPIWDKPVLRLSATQVGAYENCPLAFAYQYAIGARSEGGVQARVGTLTHSIFEPYLRPGDGPTTYERLLQIAEDLWDPKIFDYRPQAADYRRRLDESLARWWEAEGQFLGTNRTVVAVEHQFTVPVGPHTLTGFIDRIDRVSTRDADGTGEDALEIVDYKTGTKPPGTFDHENLQLAVYHLAAVRDPAVVALGRPTRLRLHYLQAGQDIDQLIAPDHEAKTEARILAAADAMLAERFDPSPAAECEYCEFARLCPLQPEGREVPS
jgi:RecB family exonuclease